MDAVNAEEVVCIETGRAFRDIWRAVCGNSPGRYSCNGMGSGADAPRRGVSYLDPLIVDIRQTPDDVTVF